MIDVKLLGLQPDCSGICGDMWICGMFRDMWRGFISGQKFNPS